MRLAFIVSHPIQYYVPLYRRLAERSDVNVKVFYTWHGGEGKVLDHGFKQAVAWDIPLTSGYEYEVVPNTSRNPGTHRFGGLQNPDLVSSVLAWRPDAVHLTGYAYASHLQALRVLAGREIPVLFRGDSHLLDQQGWKWRFKQGLLRLVYRWPSAFLYVGKWNREYYRAFGVPESKLFYCPHSIEYERFMGPADSLEADAEVWRASLGISREQVVLLFVGKFEDKKRPLELMRAVREYQDERLVLVLVGDGEHSPEVKRLASEDPKRFRVLPFQNQTRMPVVYRLGDIVTLPSAYGETWGLAVNEAIACGRPVLVSSHVGCGADVVTNGVNGEIFRSEDWDDFRVKLRQMLSGCCRVRRSAIQESGAPFSIASTENHLIRALHQVVPRQ